MSAPLTTRDLAVIGFPPAGSPDGLLLMLQVYLDDTGTDVSSPVIGVAGVVGTDAEWQEFDAAWRALLLEPLPGKPPLRQWSSSDCRWGENEFEGYNDADRDLVTARFRAALTASPVLTATNLIDKLAWNELLGGFPKLPTPEEMALFQVIERITKWEGQTTARRVALFYDKGRENISQVSPILHEAGNRLPNVDSVAFVPVEKATPLQAADMIATEAFWYAKEWVKHGKAAPMRAHLRAYLKENWNKGDSQILDRDAIKKHAARLNPDGTLKHDPSRTFWQWVAQLS